MRPTPSPSAILEVISPDPTFSVSHANTPLYDQDFYAWTLQQAELLRTGQLERLDLENLIEEIESWGKPQRQELRNRLGILLGHLLKLIDRTPPHARPTAIHMPLFRG